MKFKILFYLTFVLFFACSKDDSEVDSAVEHTIDSSLTECYDIDEKYITEINSNSTTSLIRYSSNEYIIYNHSDDLLIRIDADLNIVWQRNYPHLSGTIQINQIIQNEDGEILILSEKTNQYSELTKLSSDGNVIEWKSRFENNSTKPCYNTIVESNDSGYIISGALFKLTGGAPDESPWQSLVTKVDENGDEIWSEILPSENSDIIRTSIKFLDKYIVLGGDVTSGSNELFYYSFDENGSFSNRILLGSYRNWFTKTISTADNGFITISQIDFSEEQGASNTQYQVIKVNAQEEIEWTNSYGGDARELAYDIIPSIDGGFYLSGNTTSYGFGHFDILIIKIDADGNTVWKSTYGTSERNFGGKITEMSNSDLIITGVTGDGDNKKLFIMKLDKNGVPK